MDRSGHCVTSLPPNQKVVLSSPHHLRTAQVAFTSHPINTAESSTHHTVAVEQMSSCRRTVEIMYAVGMIIMNTKRISLILITGDFSEVWTFIN